MSKKNRQIRLEKSRANSRGRRFRSVLLMMGIIVFGGLLILWQRDSFAMPGFLQTPVPITPTLNPAFAGVEGCRANPKFFSDMAVADNPVVGTAFRNHVGFMVFDRNGTQQLFQHPSWRSAGNLGAFINDSFGNFYIIPVPAVSLELNPPEKQTILYRIDGDSGEMAPVLALPAEVPPSTTNPFGLMGLGLDCETNSLYVTSVAGSSAAQVLGKIFRIDLGTMQVADQYEGVDAIGVGVFKGINGKRLYFGDARKPLVYSIPLNEDGNFNGEPREEFSIATIPDVGNQRVRRISFAAVQEMSLRTVEFNFSLRASSEVPANQITLYYDPVTDGWVVTNVAPFGTEP
jgi:hypothetical protein